MLDQDTWDDLLASAEQAGDLGRKAAYAIAFRSVLADSIEPSDLIRSGSRVVIDWDEVGKKGYGLGSGATFLLALCASLDRSREKVPMRGLWELDQTQRMIVLENLAHYLTGPGVR